MLQYIIAGALIFEIIRLFGQPDASTVKYSKPTPGKPPESIAPTSEPGKLHVG
ncbi:unnamed protein product, partial [Haemonchus placei]|uniref:Twin-arginine translocase TatA/TatE family subunit n=1 Tax=Haemonchus placei TaxID=6290 RepID=A0A0N4WWG1_HAEPC